MSGKHLVGMICPLLPHRQLQFPGCISDTKRKLPRVWLRGGDGTIINFTTSKVHHLFWWGQCWLNTSEKMNHKNTYSMHLPGNSEARVIETSYAIEKSNFKSLNFMMLACHLTILWLRQGGIKVKTSLCKIRGLGAQGKRTILFNIDVHSKVYMRLYEGDKVFEYWNEGIIKSEPRNYVVTVGFFSIRSSFFFSLSTCSR